MNKCNFTNSSNKSCGARPLKDDDYCFFHSEKYKKQHSEAVLRGGLSLKKNHNSWERMHIKSSEDVIKLLEKTMNELMENKISNKTANTIGFLAGNAMRAFMQDMREKDEKRTAKRLGYEY